MKLKDIPEVMLGKKEIQGKCETWESDGYGKYYNQALTAQGEMEVELDRDETAKVLASVKVQDWCEDGLSRHLGELLDKDSINIITQHLSDNLPSILKVVKK